MLCATFFRNGPNKPPTEQGPGPSAPSTEPRTYSSHHGTIIYQGPTPGPASRSPAPAVFPTPQFRSRHRRPHSIHIISYPSGYVPRELRGQLGPRRSKPLLATDLARKEKRKAEKRKKERESENQKAKDKQRASPVLGKSGNHNVLEKLLSRFASQAVPSSPANTTPATDCPPKPRSRASDGLSSISRRLSGFLDFDINDPMLQSSAAAEAMRPRSAVQLVSNHRSSFMSTRSAKSIMSSAVSELPEKPVASGSGMTCSIVLAEPNVFLTGFDHDTNSRLDSHNSTALLRGKLQLNVTKNVKIRSVTLKLSGKARTDWPEGIPPTKNETYEEESLRTQALTFFNALHEGSWDTPYGNQCTYKVRTSEESEGIAKMRTPTQSALSLALAAPNRQRGTNPRDYKRLSLQSVQSRSFSKGESLAAKDVQNKGYKVFYPGKYEYSFELPIDHHQLETIKLQYGAVKWELEALVDRAGAFKPNLHGTKEVNIVRVPDQMSLETSEPISISRQWEDQLHYDIMISGKSFPIGGTIPIAFKLTPLAKVQIHKIKVFATESIEYFTQNRAVTRKDPGRKILLLEKTAGKPLSKAYEDSEVRVLSGGELSQAERQDARECATRRRIAQAARFGANPEPLPEITENILGDLDLGLESYWAATEMEMNVRLPTCERMAKDKAMRIHPDCSWRNVHVYHWIKIVLRLSRLDADDPAGKRRRHFEISIDSPFTVLNCRATQANTALPRYTGPQLETGHRQTRACGCPGAEVLATDPSPASSSGTLDEQPTASSALHNAALPLPPQAAHVHNSTIGSPTSPASSSRPPSSSDPLRRVRLQHGADDGGGAPRPIHLIRYPSFNPPAFDADEPPPPHTSGPPEDITAPTPPPQYDLVVGTPSVDGLADYFARLADYEDADGGGSSDDSDSYPARTVERSGRVNVSNPRTPGGRSIPSRSMEINRNFGELSFDGVLGMRRGV